MHLLSQRWLFLIPVMGMLAYPFLPGGPLRNIDYDAVALIAIGLAFWGLRRQRPPRGSGWLLVVLGYGCWVLGDLLYALENHLLGLYAYPNFSDGVYVSGYVLLVVGLLKMVRRRGARGDIAALLDAAIIATGTGVVAGLFVITPVAHDSTLNLAGKLVSSFYPIADVLLLAILVRLLTAPGARTAAAKLLIGSLCATLFSDIAWNIWMVTTGEFDGTVWIDLGWLAGYVLVAAAVCSPSALEVSELRAAGSEETELGRRTVALAGGLLLPPTAMLAACLTVGLEGWPVVVAGSFLLSAFVVTRMVGLLNVVRSQAVQLAALAGSDSLTGVPNRRTWDFELSRACQESRDTGQPLAVALIDLDHFKSYNDTYGHLAGDLVLRECTAAWTDLLREGEVLARYGGEEFAVLFPRRTPAQARERLLSLQQVTARGQTFSAGVAAWDPATDPSAAVSAADDALYEAKRAGRNRVVCANGCDAAPVLPSLSIVVQPIVDLHDARPVAVEALSRFPDKDPETAFSEAYASGVGPQLEAAAISAALDQRQVGQMMSINVSLHALTSPEVQAALSGDLMGVMLEMTEQLDVEPTVALVQTLRSLRRRGAVIAIDDWGCGFSNLDRLLMLRPEILKLDMSLIKSLDSPYHRTTIAAVVSWADTVGAKVCAEGIETEDQWRTLQELGVHMGQGYYFGRPGPQVAGSADVELPGGRRTPELA